MAKGNLILEVAVNKVTYCVVFYLGCGLLVQRENMATPSSSLGERHLMRHTPFDAKELERITKIPNWDTDFTHCEIEFRDPLYSRILRFVQEVSLCI